MVKEKRGDKSDWLVSRVMCWLIPSVGDHILANHHFFQDYPRTMHHRTFASVNFVRHNFVRNPLTYKNILKLKRCKRTVVSIKGRALGTLEVDYNDSPLSRLIVHLRCWFCQKGIRLSALSQCRRCIGFDRPSANYSLSIFSSGLSSVCSSVQ